MIIGQAIIWTSSDVGICAVSQQGRAIGIAPGRATVTALCGKVSGVAQIKVKTPPVEQVVIEPGDVSIEVEESRRLSPTIIGPLDRVLTGRTVTWRSSVPTVVTVSADGVIRGVSPGTAAVIAACEGKEGLASISVRSQPVVAVRIQPARLQLERGRSLQLRAVGEDRRGRPLSDRGLEWQSGDDRVALVDASGKVHAVGEGRTLVHATAGDVTSSIEVVVVPRVAAELRIGAHPPTLDVGDYLSLDVVVLDAEGASLDGRVITWSTSDPKVLAVNNAGVCEGKKAGSARLTATCENVKAATKLTVRAPVVKVEVPPKAPVEVPVAVASALESSHGTRAHIAPADRALGAPEVTTGSAAPVRKRSLVLPVGVALAAALGIGAWLGMRRDTSGSQQSSSPQTASPQLASRTLAAAAARADSAPHSPAIVPPPKPEPVATVEPKAAPATSSPPQKVAAASTSDAKRNATTVPAPALVQPPPVSPSRNQQATAPAKGPDVKPADTKTTSRADTSVVPAKAIVPPPVTQRAEAPPTTVPQPVAQNVPSTPAPAPSRNADADRAMLCTDAASATSLLTDALSEDPAGRLAALYRPRDAADAKAKDALVGTVKDAQRLKAAVHVVRSETNADGCDWVVGLDLTWTNAFGQPRHKSPQIRLQLEAAAGRARVKQLFGATGL